MSISFEVYSDEWWVDLRVTVRNDTDEPVHYRTGGSFYVIVDASNCEVVWSAPTDHVREPRDDVTLEPGSAYGVGPAWRRNVDGGWRVPPGNYLAYFLFRFAQPRAEPPVPDTVYISSPRLIEVKAVQRADSASTKATSSLRMIDLGYGESVARQGRKLIVRNPESYVNKDGILTPIYTFYEVDLDTEERRKIPEPGHYQARPRRSCVPPTDRTAMIELELAYAEQSGKDHGYTLFDVKGVLEVNLERESAWAFVFVGTHGERYWYLDPRVDPIVWSDDCRYAAWAISGGCDTLPHVEPAGVYLYDAETDTTTRLREDWGGGVSFWDDLLVMTGIWRSPFCGTVGTTGVFLE